MLPGQGVVLYPTQQHLLEEYFEDYLVPIFENATTNEKSRHTAYYMLLELIYGNEASIKKTLSTCCPAEHLTTILNINLAIHALVTNQLSDDDILIKSILDPRLGTKPESFSTMKKEIASWVRDAMICWLKDQYPDTFEEALQHFPEALAQENKVAVPSFRK